MGSCKYRITAQSWSSSPSVELEAESITSGFLLQILAVQEEREALFIKESAMSVCEPCLEEKCQENYFLAFLSRRSSL